MSISLFTAIKGFLAQDSDDRTKQVSLEVSPSATTGTRTSIIATQTADRTITLPNSDLDLNDVVTDNSVSTLTNKTIDADQNTITNIENADIKVNAAINRSKIASGSINQVVINDGSGVLSSEAQLAISRGGTGQTTANAALNALLPNQATHSGEYLTTDGTNASWVVGSGGGANLTLSNLNSPVALNQDLLPNAGGAQDLGSTLLPFGAVIAQSASIPIVQFGGALNGRLINDTTPSGASAHVIQNNAASINIGAVTTDQTSGNTGTIYLESGNNSVTGNSGNIQLRTGTVVSGTRGKVKLADGTEGTIGHVLTSSAIDGTMGWAAPAAVTGTSKLRNLTASNNGLNPNTQWDLNVSIITLVNASNQTVTMSGSGLTNDITVAGSTANGRDQVGAFSNSSWVYFFYIWNGSTLATLSSASSTSPTLPSGYTHFALCSAVYKNSSGNLEQMYQRGNWITRADNSSAYASGLSATSATTVNITDAIPPNALSYNLSYLGITVSTAGGVADSRITIYTSGSNVYDLIDGTFTGLGATQATTTQKGNIVIPNRSQFFRYSWSVAGGSGQTLAIRILGYQIPNGAE